MVDGITAVFSGLDGLAGPLGALAVVGGFAYWLGSVFERQNSQATLARLDAEKEKAEKELADARRAAQGQKEAANSPSRLWSNAFSAQDLAIYAKQAKPKALVVANLKGGVGKSTIAASLACHFATKRAMKVLLVDLDFQGTATTLAKLQAGMTLNDCKIGRVLESPEITPVLFDLPEQLGGDTPNLSLLSANEDLDEIENGLLLKSTLGLGADGDVRLRLCRYLRSEEIAKRFDLVVLDTPPRFSAAAVNGMLAATHIVVPTKLEASSTMATIRFCERLRRLQQTGYPASNFLGVVPAMTQARPNLTRAEVDACNALDDRLEDFGLKTAVIRDGWVPDTTAIGSAARDGIAYMQDNNARAIFDDLGGAIHKRM